MRSLFSPPSRRRSTLLAAVAAAVAAAAFLNTLPAQFTFDDSFAVVCIWCLFFRECLLRLFGYSYLPE